MAAPAAFEWTPLQDASSPYPTQMLCRLADSIFFYLNASCEPVDTGFVEPAKLAHFLRVLDVPDGMNMGVLRPQVLMAAYNALGVRFESVYGPAPAQSMHMGRPSLLRGLMDGGGQQQVVVPALTQQGFTHILDLMILRAPARFHVLLNRAIHDFQLKDPLTSLPFPLLPRWALPAQPDPMVVQQFEHLRQMGRQAAQTRLANAQAVASVRIQAARAVRDAAAPSGSYTYTYR